MAVVDQAADKGGTADASGKTESGSPPPDQAPASEASPKETAADESGAQASVSSKVPAPPSEPPLPKTREDDQRSTASSGTAVSAGQDRAAQDGAAQDSASQDGAAQDSASKDGAGKPDPPGELAPAESDVPPPPSPAAAKRQKAQTITLADASNIAEHTTQRRAARARKPEDEVDEGWGEPSSSKSRPGPGRSGDGPARPTLPRRPRPGIPPRPAPSSPASLGLGARPLSTRPQPTGEDDDADDIPTTQAERPVELIAEATRTNTAIRAANPGDADATAALPQHREQREAARRSSGPVPSAPPPMSVDPNTATPFSSKPPGLGPTATALHEEDEDGPTMVNYLAASMADDEATALHPSRSSFVAPVHQPPRDEPAAAPPAQRQGATTAELPPGALLMGLGATTREAAVQAALAAATEASQEQRDVRREQHLVVASAVLLGVGMVLGALGAYLTANAIAAGRPAAGASLAGANVTCCISLFAAGFATLQPKENARVGLSIAAGVMQFICFIWMLVAAF